MQTTYDMVTINNPPAGDGTWTVQQLLLEIEKYDVGLPFWDVSYNITLVETRSHMNTFNMTTTAQHVCIYSLC